MVPKSTHQPKSSSQPCRPGFRSVLGFGEGDPGAGIGTVAHLFLRCYFQLSDAELYSTAILARHRFFFRPTVQSSASSPSARDYLRCRLLFSRRQYFRRRLHLFIALLNALSVAIVSCPVLNSRVETPPPAETPEFNMGCCFFFWFFAN